MDKIQELPDFSAIDQNGHQLSTASLTGSPLVVYFYPKNFTPGCTAEACTFRDSFEDFKEVGARVIGISSDDEASHKQFSDSYQLPFHLVSDPDKKLQRLFGVKSDLFGLIPGRETFIFDSEGRLIHRFRSQLQAQKHVDEAIAAIKAAEKSNS